MTRVTFEVQDELCVALKVNPRLLAEEMLVAAAMKFMELGWLSSGAAARLAGLPVPVFLARLADYGVVTFRMSSAEISEDAHRA